MLRSVLTPERVLRRLEWRVIRRLDGRLQGDARTVLRGHGIDVADLREYLPGDEARHIDWNVTARTDIPYVREYLEDREVTGWLLLDRSASMGFGPIERRKHLVLTETAAVLAQLLARSGNRVGALLFDSRVRETIAPGHGRRQVLRILSRLLADPGGPGGADEADAPSGTTDLAVPLHAALGMIRRRSLVVLVSDFISEDGWQRPLRMLAQRHDVVALRVSDPREFDLPAVGLLHVEDPETGEQILIDSDDPEFRARLAEAAQHRDRAVRDAVRSAGTELHSISTDDDLVRAMIRIARLRRQAARQVRGGRP